MSTSLMWTNMMNNVDLDVLSVRSRASTSWFSLGFWMVLFCSVGSQIVSLSQQQWNNNQHDSVSECCKLRCILHFTPPSPVSPSDSLFCHLTEVGVGQRSEAPTRVLKPEESACKSRLNIIHPPVRNWSVTNLTNATSIISTDVYTLIQLHIMCVWETEPWYCPAASGPHQQETTTRHPHSVSRVHRISRCTKFHRDRL